MTNVNQSLILPNLKIDKRPLVYAHSKEHNQIVTTIKMNSPTSLPSNSILNKTTPISPMRERTLKSGLSRPRERPTAGGAGVILNQYNLEFPGAR